MSPNLKFNLMLEPIQFVWNGTPYTLSGSCELLPDNQVKHLHKRVLCVAQDDRGKIPFYGRVVGRARKVYDRSHNHCFYLVENESTGRIERSTKVQEVEG